MKIYLGLAGSEQLITGYDRDFDYPKKENYEDVICEDGSITRYTTDTVKHVFNFKYATITKVDLDVIETEYDSHAVLSLKIEKDTGSETYDTYNVLFDGVFDKGMEMDYPDRREYKNVSFTLKET
jgi:hypothetical protein